MLSGQAFCPGSRLLKEPIPEEVACPGCGKSVEIWTHEIKAVCPNCSTTVFRERAPSCIDWCKYAEECVGPELLAKLKGKT